MSTTSVANDLYQRAELHQTMWRTANDLNARVAGIVARQAELCTQIDAKVADLEGGAR